MTPWYRWPEDKRTGRVAWYVVARRLLFWPIFAVGLGIATAGCAAMFGASEARRFWRDAT